MESTALLVSQRMDIDEIRRTNLREESVRLRGDIKLAAILGVDKNQVYQWLRAEGKQRRNMRKTTAREAEIKLGRPQGWLDQPHVQPRAQGAPVMSDVIAESRSKNNVKALRFAVQSLFSILHERMPDIAEAVAVDIVETAGTEFARQGFLNTLLGILQGAEQMSAAVIPPSPQPVRVSSTSERAAAAARKP